MKTAWIPYLTSHHNSLFIKNHQPPSYHISLHIHHHHLEGLLWFEEEKIRELEGTSCKHKLLRKVKLFAPNSPSSRLQVCKYFSSWYALFIFNDKMMCDALFLFISLMFILVKMMESIGNYWILMFRSRVDWNCWGC